MSQQIVELVPAMHRDKEVILINCSYKSGVDALVRQIPGRTWSNSRRCWYLEASAENMKLLEERLGNKVLLRILDKEGKVVRVKGAEVLPAVPVKIALPVLGPEKEEKVRFFESWLRSKRYSENTVGTYVDALRVFLKYFNGKSVEEIQEGDLVAFNNKYILAQRLSGSYQNQMVNSLKLFFRRVENRQLDPDLIHRPKRAKVLPNVLSKEEVKLILDVPRNIKHKAMLSLIYACGLRCGELLRLKPEHVDSRRNLLIVKQSKGRKDRIVPLSVKIQEQLRAYYQAYRPQVYLFEGQRAGSMYDERSLQQVLKQNVERAGIRKPVTLHWLRHSYATHLLESGTDLRYIQEILGHSSSRTTEIYTHVSNQHIQKIVSPFDNL